MRSVLMAFSLYSRIPVPRVEWREESMRYVMCAFPLVGAVIALLQWGLFVLCDRLALSGFLKAALLAALPLLLTGGIHMDGFMDTTDARASWGDAEERRRILKDPHAGAFAILGCGIYLLLWTAGWGEIAAPALPFALIGFVVSRVLSGLSVILFQGSSETGMAAELKRSADRRRAAGILTAELILCLGMLLWLGVAGGMGYAVGVMAAAAAVFGYYRWFSVREFGGVSGDLAGWFLSAAELAQILTLALLVHLG